MKNQPLKIKDLADQLSSLDGATKDDSFVRLVTEARHRVDQVLTTMLANVPGRPEGKGHVFFYGRQSKDEQVQQHTEAGQLHEFEEYYKRKLSNFEKRWPPFFDKDVSGAVPLFRRPAGSQMNAMLKRGDHLVVTKLDRAFRSKFDGLETLHSFETRGIAVHVINMGLDMSTPVGKLTVSMLLAFAEFERDMISVRSKEGLAAWRRKGGKKAFKGVPHGWKWQGVIPTRVLVPDTVARKLYAHFMERLEQFHSVATVAQLMKYEGVICPRTRRPYGKLAIRDRLLAHVLNYPKVDQKGLHRMARAQGIKLGERVTHVKRSDGRGYDVVVQTWLGDRCLPPKVERYGDGGAKPESPPTSPQPVGQGQDPPAAQSAA